MATPNRPGSPQGPALAQVHQALQAGALSQAEAMLRQACVPGPPSFDVLHLLAVVLLQMGRHGEALPVIDSALALSPRSADAHGLRGLILNGLQRREAAEAALRQALAIKSSASEIWFNLGLILEEGGKSADAVAAFRKALRGGQDADVLHRLGLSLLAIDKADEAIPALRRAHQLRRFDSDIVIALSLAFERRGDHASMTACHRLAAVIDPGAAVTAHNIAIGHDRDGNVETAVLWYKRALAIDAAYELSQNGLVSLLLRTQQRQRAATEQAEIVDRNPLVLSGHIKLVALVLESDSLIFALALLERLLSIWPAEPIAIGFLADFFNRCAQPERALRYARRTSWLAPDNIFARIYLAGCFTALRQPSDAIAVLDEVVEAHPDHLQARQARAMAHLGVGNLAQGWEDYESRQSLIDIKPPLAPSVPVWKGEALQGSLLIRREQGVGDELMFMSCYADALQRAGAAIIECDSRLASMVQRTYRGASVCTPDQVEAIRPAAQIVAGSLPRLLRPSIDAFPDRPCLLPDPALVELWRRRLAGHDGRLKVGISWRSMRVRSNDLNLRYTTLDDWQPLFQTPGVTFFSLQYDDPTEEETRARIAHPNLVSFSDVDLRNDFEAVAGIMANLDLVISVANSVAGLAGALGVPGYQLTIEGDWTLLGSGSLPWIRNIVPLVRQAGEPSWQRVLQDAAERVALLAAARPA